MIKTLETLNIDYFGLGLIACGLGFITWTCYTGKKKYKEPFLDDTEYKTLVKILKDCENRKVKEGETIIDCYKLAEQVLNNWIIDWYNKNTNIQPSCSRSMTKVMFSPKDMEDYKKYCEDFTSNIDSIGIWDVACKYLYSWLIF